MLKVGDIIIFRSTVEKERFFPIALVLKTKTNKGLWNNSQPFVEKIKMIWLTGTRKGEIYDSEKPDLYRKVA